MMDKKYLEKIKILWLLLLCALKFIISGKANKKIEQPKKVLIIQTARLGDMICTTPVFRAIKEKYPDCQVYVMGEVVNKQLLNNHPHIDGYIILDFSHIKKLIRHIKQENFNFSCTTFPNFYAIAVMYLADIKCICAPKIIGYSPYATKTYDILKEVVIQKPHYIRQSAARQYLKLLEPLNIYTQNIKKSLVFTSLAKEKILNFFKQHDINPSSDFIVGITPTAGNKIKEWPVERFAQLADYIYDKYNAKIITIASPAEQKTIQEILHHLKPETKVINILTNIDELKALISMISLFISVDTGPVYIAEAFNVPTIDIIGPVDENDQPPQGKFNRIVVVPRKKSELYVMNARRYNYEEAKRQVNDISVEMVIKVLDELIKFIKRVGLTTDGK